MLTKAVFPVAGLGTRFLPATKAQPKEMLPVGRKPVVQYVVEELAHSGIRRLLFITGASKTSIENHFDIDDRLITYLRESGREEELAQLDFLHARLHRIPEARRLPLPNQVLDCRVADKNLAGQRQSSIGRGQEAMPTWLWFKAAGFGISQGLPAQRGGHNLPSLTGHKADGRDRGRRARVDQQHGAFPSRAFETP